jgi:nucleotide-binding universal stress UspA family protein
MTKHVSASPPVCSNEERDADGRLIAVEIDSEPPPADSAGGWLVAVDGSAHALRAVVEAERLSSELKLAVLHLINVQGWLAKEAAEVELASRCWSASRQARELLDARGQPWRLHGRMGDVAEQIVALSQRLGCRGIVIGSRGLGAAENLLVGSVAYKLIHLSTLPVLVVR